MSRYVELPSALRVVGFSFRLRLKQNRMGRVFFAPHLACHREAFIEKIAIGIKGLAIRFAYGICAITRRFFPSFRVERRLTMNAVKLIRNGQAALILCVMVLLILGTGTPSWTQSGPWRDHATPFDFLFGNHIDTHQETNLITTGSSESLFGRFYIYFIGDTDPASGLPVARHPRGPSQNELCGLDVDCVTGWEMRGMPGAAKFVSHSGVNGEDHPLWLVNRAEEAAAPAAGMVIPQPGSFTHFHWITTTSTDPRATDVSAACDKDDAGQLQNSAPSAVNQVCEGWFLEIKAVRAFAFEHGGELIPIRPGMDSRSHTNVLTNFNNDVVITTTR